MNPFGIDCQSVVALCCRVGVRSVRMTSEEMVMADWNVFPLGGVMKESGAKCKSFTGLKPQAYASDSGFLSCSWRSPGEVAVGWGGGSSKEEPSCWRLGPAVPLAQVAQAKDRTSLQLLGYGRLHPNAEPLGRKRTPPPCHVCIESLSPSTARNTFRKGRVEGLVVMGGWVGWGISNGPPTTQSASENRRPLPWGRLAGLGQPSG